MKSWKSLQIWAAAVTLTGAVGLAHAQNAKGASVPGPLVRQDERVTPVSGESWLKHLNRAFNDTSMGKTTHLGPAAWESATAEVYSLPNGNETRNVRGHDIFRMNCQGCHGETGAGAPPEINSVLDPVRATSVPLVMARLKALGMNVRQADAAAWARKADSVLLQRLHNGGEEMPAFHHLREAEVSSLHGYLRQLAGVPGAAAEQITVKISAVHTGEQIVKSTCHTCHSATGANPTPQQMMDGEIPPLSTLLARKSRADFVRKVIHGAPVVMGTEPMLYRGRMPVFDYLTAEEAADAYLYLQLYPPTEAADPERSLALVPGSSAGVTRTPSPPTASQARVVLSSAAMAGDPQRAGSDTRTVLAVAVVIAFVLTLLALGVVITIREFRKLSAKTVGTGQRERAFQDRSAQESASLQSVA